MATKHRSSTVEIEGKSYSLTFDINALIWLEDELHTDLDELDAALQAAKVEGSVSLTQLKLLRAMFFAGLRRDQPDLTLEDAGALIFTTNAAEVSEAVGKAMGTETVLKPDSEEGLHDDSPLSVPTAEAAKPSGPSRSSTSASRRTSQEDSLSASSAS